MEILSRDRYPEYEAFVSSHPRGEFMQSTLWQQVKSNWQWEAVVSRDEAGKIAGACGVLVQRMPVLGTALLYAPRGPVCDLHDRAVMADLKRGIDALAKKHRAHLFKMDPDVAADDDGFLNIADELGFSRFYGPDGFETIQARFNYRLYLRGRSREELLAGFTQKTRYNIRVAQKHGVELQVAGPEALDDFMRIYRTTGARDGFSTRPKEYFARMLSALGEHCRLYMGYYQGEAVCGAIATNYAGKVCYVYGASDNAHRNVMPNYLMQWEMIQWAVDTGCTVYDFQGISGDLENEQGHMYGLYRFKRGFGGQVDELAGEFNYVYRPVMERLAALGIWGNDRLRTLRRRLKK